MWEKVLAKASTLRRKRGAVDASGHASGRGRYRSTRRSAAHAWVCGMRAGAARFAFGAPPNALKFGQHRLARPQRLGDRLGALRADLVQQEVEIGQDRAARKMADASALTPDTSYVPLPNWSSPQS